MPEPLILHHQRPRAEAARRIVGGAERHRRRSRDGRAAKASIWYGAVLRAEFEPIEIGEGSNIQDNVTVHVDPGFPASIGAGVSVGHNAVLHGCTIEDGCLIGMGAVVLNGALIGAGLAGRRGRRGRPGRGHPAAVVGGRRARARSGAS